MNFLFCPDANPNFLNFFDFSIAPKLLFYSYIPILFIAIVFGIFIWKHGKKTVSSKYLLSITLAFAVWILLIILQWTAISVEIVHLAWQLLIIPELLIYIFSIYFCYSFLFEKEVPVLLKYPLSLIYLFAVIMVPSTLNIVSFDLANCQGNLGQLWDMAYVFEMICFVIIPVIAFEKFKRGSSSKEKKIAIFLSGGIVFFLGIFWVSNYFGEITKAYQINLIGPIGMAVFLGILSYMIVSLRAFHIKLLGAQVLVVTLWTLVGSLLFIRNIDYIHVVVAITSIMVLLGGIQLIRSVKKEVELRESLQIANEGQTNLIHVLNHQIKGYLAKARGIFAELLTEESYGPISESAKPMLQTGFNSLTEGVGFVEQVLNSSSAESGTLVYNMQPLDLKTLVTEAVDKQKEPISKKNLSLEMNVAEGQYNILGDAMQLKEALRDLIDNSINYTPAGGLKINLSNEANKILFSITDTGVGISEEDKSKLFTKGGRGKDSLKLNVNSTGYGLSFVKAVIEAHRGRVWAESAGVGRGSTFFVELPIS